MAVQLAAEIAALQRLPVPALQRKYADLFGDETRSNHKTWLIKRIIWRLQAQSEAPLSERSRQRARDLAADSQLRLSEPQAARSKTGSDAEAVPPQATTQGDERVPLPGSIITRRYKGELLQVKVRDDGFEFDGAVYTSLSAVAAVICGSHCNGFLFFRLGKYGDKR